MDLEHLPAQSLHSTVHTEHWPNKMPAYSDDAVHHKDVTGPYWNIPPNYSGNASRGIFAAPVRI